MQALGYPAVKDLVLVGGGHAHALVLLRWAMQPMPGVRLTLINPGAAAPYTGMLPGLIAGHYARDEIMIDLMRLGRQAGARLILDRATGIDRDRRLVHLAGRPPVTYDLMSLDIGIGSDLPDIPGYGDHAVAAKPLGRYAETWERFLSRDLPNPRLVIIGGGVGGVELALASHHRLARLGRRPAITIIEREAEALPNIGRAARARLVQHCAEAGVRFVTGAEATQIRADAVQLSTGETLPSDFTLSVAGTRPQGWLAGTGLALHQGFVSVGPTLQSSDPLIFAAGDCAHLSHAPRPKAGVFAVREAPVLMHNLRAALSGGRLKAYHPQRDYLKLVSTGGKGAVADKFGLRSGGGWLWRVKDRIDRKFMAMFTAGGPMLQPLPAGPRVEGLLEAMGTKPLCGGCGAKLGAEGLSAALAGLPAPSRTDVLSGRGDDAAVLRAGPGVQVITTDHLRALTEDPRLMARIAATHALGDIFAMGARPQAALAQVILPRLSETLGARTLAEIMDEAAQVFAEAGADIVGGHSSTGAELTVGFTVTGLADRAISKAGAEPGDVLILTKPLGTGTVLAAEMAMARLPGLVLGEAVAACLASMAESLGPAAALLAPQAHAMTDVTGFGLAGHLLEICAASGCGATLRLADLPLLPAAEALAAAGEASSLAPANRAACLGRISGPLTTPRAALIFDPQTCGGLLAAVPAKAAPALLAAVPAARAIGEITAGPARITCA
ncbi:selenide, water dikinase SelD [Tabrizicola oligotrophica]|uniref:Selenide, water dikinase SelD n=1 Tax=Tabrizicola oligotrophica TaxID=2710650 RepID=A0A6M0QVP0_9RHOB|nr:selenide, water dikinase SelD [Tabrizicola oligotrophica]NEY91495.1 selenide, water dikinase SelD [Tabrizicola oligotrophica]